MSIRNNIDHMGFEMVGWLWFVCYSNETVASFDTTKEHKNNNGLAFNMNHIHYTHRNKLQVHWHLKCRLPCYNMTNKLYS